MGGFGELIGAIIVRDAEGVFVIEDIDDVHRPKNVGTDFGRVLGD